MERYAIIIRPNEEMALLHCYPGDSLDLKTLQENEIYYTACWRELQSFLAEVVRDDTGEYPQAADFLKLMKSIERKVESDAE